MAEKGDAANCKIRGPCDAGRSLLLSERTKEGFCTVVALAVIRKEYRWLEYADGEANHTGGKRKNGR